MNPELHQANINTLTYDKTTRIGYLVDCISCHVIEERNGIFELEAEFPAGGALVDQIKEGSVIRCATGNERAFLYYMNPVTSFDVYSVRKDIKGRVLVKGEHITYRMSRIPVIYRVGATSGDKRLSDVLYTIRQSCQETNSFRLGYYGTFGDLSNNFALTTPRSMRECLLNREGSVLDRFGGEWVWNDKGGDICQARGTVHKLVGGIRYGYNMTDLVYTRSAENLLTGILPYWADSDGNNVITGSIQYSANAGDYTAPRTAIHDFSGDFRDQPTADQLNTAAAAYVAANLRTTPAQTLKVKFVPIMQELDGKDIPPEKICLCDTLPVVHDGYGIATEAKVIRTDYDVLKERYASLEVGTVTKSLDKTLAQTARAAGVSLYV